VLVPAAADRRDRPGVRGLERIIARGQEEGEFRGDLDPRMVSYVFYGALEEILTGWVLGQLDDGDEQIAAAEQTVIEVVCGGLAPDREAGRSSFVAQPDRSAAAREPSVRTRLFWTLGLGAFGLAFSITTTAAYLPPLLDRSRIRNADRARARSRGGVRARALPVIGPWSDTFHTPLGRRRPFMLAALGPMGFCLLLMAFMPNLWTTTLIVLAFFFAY
jgi:hypothetical protein